MANNDKKDNSVDEMGIRLAPAPMRRSDANMLPSVQQEFVLRPVLDIDEPDAAAGSAAEVSTVDDFQPKRKDVDKRYKRKKRSKNIVCGLLMFVFSALVLLPYILAAVGENLDFVPFKFVPSEYNVIGSLIAGFKLLSADWSNTAVWKSMLPDYILGLGLVFIVINLVKSFTGICGAIKVRRYTFCAVIYLIAALAVFIAALVGAESYGIAKIDFMSDVIKGWQTSEFIGIFMLAVANIIAAVVCSLINPERSGYTK